MRNLYKTLKAALKKTFLRQVVIRLKIFVKILINKQKYSMEYEAPVSLGRKNPDKIFYVIGYWHDENFLRQGIISTWRDFMPKVLYALQKGYIPIIDMMNNYKPMLLDENNKGKINAWNIYFQQPQSIYTLEEILHSKKVIFAKGQGFPLSYDVQWSNIPLSNRDFEFCQNMMKYSKLSDEVLRLGDNFILEKFPKGEKILGCSFRRAFERLHFFNAEITPQGTHIVRATLSSLIKEINIALSNFKYNYIFFSSDDRESYNVVKKEFGNKCIYVDRPTERHFIDNKPIPLDRLDLQNIELNKRENDCMLRGIEYMTDVYILSKCDSLLSAGASADLFAYILNNKKYEHVIQPKQ